MVPYGEMLKAFSDLLKEMTDTKLTRIGQLENTSDQLRKSALSSEDRIRQIERRLDMVSLLAAALWYLLKKNGNFTDEQLVKALMEMHQSPPAIAGIAPADTIAPRDIPCPACNHRISLNAVKCMYCGAQVKQVVEK